MNKYFTVNAEGCSIRCKLYAEGNADVRKVILFGHGFGGHKDNRAAERFALRVLEKNKGVATGMELEPFAELFKNEGCVTAYNLDGGMSTDIVFMGEHLRERDEKRNLPDMLLFGHTDLLPDENDPSPDHYEMGVGENGEPIIVPKQH
jgi:hypothetical protein